MIFNFNCRRDSEPSFVMGFLLTITSSAITLTEMKDFYFYTIEKVSCLLILSLSCREMKMFLLCLREVNS